MDLKEALAVVAENGYRAIKPDEVSPRLRQVGLLIAEGYSNKEIANHLNLTEATVKVHIKALFKQYGCSNRVQFAILRKTGKHPLSMEENPDVKSLLNEDRTV